MIKFKTSKLQRMLSRKPDTDEMLETAAMRVVDDMVELAPHDTGELRNSLRILEKGKDYIEVGSDVEHAVYVEFGTKYSRAQPYLRPALLRAKIQIGDIVW